MDKRCKTFQLYKAPNYAEGGSPNYVGDKVCGCPGKKVVIRDHQDGLSAICMKLSSTDTCDWTFYHGSAPRESNSLNYNGYTYSVAGLGPCT